MTAPRPITFVPYLTLLSVFVLVLPQPSFAAEGVLEINQICATTGGCFPGDTPDFPVTLTQPGQYRLTGNLVVPDENTTAISIFASHVAIDLAGFRIEGPGTTGTGDGIAQPLAFSHARVQNGFVVGVGNRGLVLEQNSRAEGVTVEDSGGTGIQMDFGSVVRDCIVRRAGADGISLGGGSRVIGNLVEDAGGVGIDESNASLIFDNVVRGSTSFGLRSNTNSIFGGNSFTLNSGGGTLAPQTGPSLPVTLSGNICGSDTTCP